MEMIEDSRLKLNIHKKGITKGYFKAPIENLLHHHARPEVVCDNCNKKKKTHTILPNGATENNIICTDCLLIENYIFIHDTSLGLVVAEKLPNFMEMYSKMLETPNYFSFHGEQWLCHCNDFMTYLGTWEAPDFTYMATKGTGKQLFMQMTPKHNHIWDLFQLDENESEGSWSNCLYHVFECNHCSTKNGYWER